MCVIPNQSYFESVVALRIQCRFGSFFFFSRFLLSFFLFLIFCSNYYEERENDERERVSERERERERERNF